MRSMFVPKTKGMTFLAAGIAAILGTLTLRLYKNDFTPDENLTTAAAQVTEANFSGYTAATAQEFSDHYLATDGLHAKAHIFHQFDFTAPGEGSPVTNQIFGYYLTDGDDNVVGAARFDDPISVNSDNASVPAYVTLEMLLPSLGIS